ncbi:uncharacterized protein LOC126373008 isoform X2 [Pectinophora gossypiella]|uniref:uncharacterized protein LOC126372092 isoform X2 n=1 Tax=Pectinophora gossypiella TaxID=13191 RepID=UPI00214F54B0|nr:uncharacterized protein LOC126372092 isoform X2 [Pectinophora gossypiella]XP_049874906.1 uncharacterized protein LOC126373008 isoform X2 [Pectinophora gossypiella]
MSTGSDKGGGTDQSTQMKELVCSRGAKKGQLTKFNNFITTLGQIPIENITSLQHKELIFRLSKIENVIHEFNEIQTRIEFLSEDIKHTIERDIFEDLYYSSIPIAQELIESYLKANPVDKSDGNSDHSHISVKTGCNQLNNIKLPTISLPKFDGNYLKWLEFRDTFDALINSNETILDINKFHYLRLSLEGSATVVIKSIEFTSKNYKVAWNLLCSRYDNKKVLINNHLKALFSVEPLTRESHKAIQFLIDHTLKNLRSLESLGQPTDKWDVLIIYIMASKLDPNTLSKWEEHKSASLDGESLDEFIAFLRKRADVLETIFFGKSDKQINKPFSSNKVKYTDNDNYKRSSPQNNQKSFVASGKSNRNYNPTCPFCKENHRIVECDKFKKISPEDRSGEALKLNLCLNCLRRGHSVKDCRLDGRCRECRQQHNTLLHVDQNVNKDNNQVYQSTSIPISLAAQSASQVLLGTAMVQVVNTKTKNTYLARALLDAGSQSSFITSNLKNKMGIISEKTDFCITGISNAPIHLSDSCEVTIQSLNGRFTVALKCLVMPNITGHLPNTPVDISRLNLPANIKLADPKFYQPSSIDLLLGAEIFFDVITTNKLNIGPGMPILQDSKFGWIVAGPLNVCKDIPRNTFCNFTKDINHNLIKFWNIEEVSLQKSPMSPHDEFCERHFVQNTTRLANGRFSVKMPLLEDPEKSLGESYYMAERRFLSLEKKFIKNLDLKNLYRNFINEYEELGHLTKINKPSFGYFMPHHAVIRESSETTKLRVVFDASAKTKSNKSLNDIQAIGPTVQDELFDILIRFRQHKYVLSGDIAKMYRQIMIDESQRHLQLILWRDDDTKPINILQLNTVTYGTAAAPFLSTRCLLQLANECTDPLISEVIKHDFYVDDLLTGSSNEDELLHIHKGVTETLASARLPIHKFRTNCPNIFSSSTESKILNLDKESSVLGVLWAPNTDTLKFSINIDTNAQTLTKRIILSNTCRIFDPLGLLSASTITLKVLLQKLWKLKLEWDDPVPNEIKKSWEKVINNLNLFLTVSVPRHVMCASPVKTELHCFVDASQDAYAACIYLRSLDEHNSTCGTDFAGPFMISSKKGRGNRVSKSYLCLFVCFSTKAVHLEVVSDLSTAAFIACLKRFISRRGKPHYIYCDNAKNFVGAKNELGRMLRSSLRSVYEYTANEGIKFTFNPPYSPTFGGLWEAGVKSAKHHVKRIVGNANLTFEELSTLFTQIEAILNSRPLTPLSHDPNDLSPLTPGHFLIGRPLTSLPAPPGDNMKLKNRYILIENLRQRFWERWRHEYLSEMQQRTKGRLRNSNLQLGDLVVFKEENLPPLKWRLGRAQKLYPGADGVVRVADFLTFRGTERRAVNKVCPLIPQPQQQPQTR